MVSSNCESSPWQGPTFKIVCIHTHIYVYICLLKMYFWLHWGLCCFAWTFCSCGKQGLLFIEVHWPLLLQTASFRYARFSSCGTWLSCSSVCGIFPEQGSNLFPLALAGRFLSTAPPLKSNIYAFNDIFCHFLLLKCLIFLGDQ